jgi:hypothetical protein
MRVLSWIVVGVFGLGLSACSERDSLGGLNGEGGSGGADEATVAGAGMAGAAELDCSAVEDEQGGMLTIRLVNDTSAAIHLGEEEHGCFPSRGWRFIVRDGTGARLADVGVCQTCRAATVTGVGDCPTICLRASALTLAPGEHADLSWDGLFSTSVPLPKACALAPAAPSECRKATRVQPGSYVFSALAGSSMLCDESDVACSKCQPRETGGCETNGALVESLDLEASTETTLGEGPTFGVVDPIELVFRD